MLSRLAEPNMNVPPFRDGSLWNIDQALRSDLGLMCRWVKSSKCCHSAVSHTALKQAFQSGDPNMATHSAFRKSESTAVCKDYPIKHVKGFHMKFFSWTLDIWEPTCGRHSVSVIFGWGILGRPSFLILFSPLVCSGWPLFWITYGFLLSHPPGPNCVYFYCGWLADEEWDYSPLLPTSARDPHLLNNQSRAEVRFLRPVNHHNPMELGLAV